MRVCSACGKCRFDYGACTMRFNQLVPQNVAYSVRLFQALNVVKGNGVVGVYARAACAAQWQYSAHVQRAAVQPQKCVRRHI